MGGACREPESLCERITRTSDSRIQASCSHPLLRLAGVEAPSPLDAVKKKRVPARRGEGQGVGEACPKEEAGVW